MIGTHRRSVWTIPQIDLIASKSSYSFYSAGLALAIDAANESRVVHMRVA